MIQQKITEIAEILGWSVDFSMVFRSILPVIVTWMKTTPM